MLGEPWKVPMREQPAGVYALVRQGQVLYVGQSLNIFARTAQHNNNMRKFLKRGRRPNIAPHNWPDGVTVVFDEVWFWLCPEAELDKEEMALIQKYLPEQNVRLNRPRKPIEEKIRHLPFVVALIQKAEDSKRRGEFRRRIVG